MKSYFRILCAIGAFMVLYGGTVSTDQFRNIFAYTYIDYDGAGTSNVFENTFIAPVRPGTSMLVRAYHDRRSDWNNTIVTFGPVFNLDRYHYVEFTYGYGRDSDKRRADYLAVELTREKPGYLAGIGFRHSAYPGYSYNTLSPSIRYWVTPRIALWGKYFASKDSDGNFDHAYWTDIEYSFTRFLALRCGVTGGNRLYSPEYETLLGGRADMSFHSLIAQCSWNLTGTLTLKYLYENLSRQSRFNDIKNSIIIDARF